VDKYSQEVGRRMGISYTLSLLNKVFDQTVTTRLAVPFNADSITTAGE